MAFQFVKKWATIGCVALIAVVGLTRHSRAQNSGYASFYCGNHGGKPATIADHPVRGDITLIVWQSPYFINAGYDPQKRCDEVSKRFQRFQSDGSLSKIAPGKTGNEQVLCAIRNLNNYIGSCPDSNVLMTLKPGDDAQAMVNRIGDLNMDNSTDYIEHSASIFEQYGDMTVLNIDVMLNYSQPAK